MKISAKLLSIVASVMVLLSIGAASAAALRSLELSERQIEFLGTNVELGGEGARVVCNVAMTVRLPERRFSKRIFNPLGTVFVKVLGQETETESCIENRGFVLRRELGGTYNINYLGFTGTLPNITGLHIQILRLEFLVTAFEGRVRCLVRTNALGTEKVERGSLTSLGQEFVLESITVVPVESLFPCPRPETIHIEGAFRAVNRTVSVRLL